MALETPGPQNPGKSLEAPGALPPACPGRSLPWAHPRCAAAPSLPPLVSPVSTLPGPRSLGDLVPCDGAVLLPSATTQGHSSALLPLLTARIVWPRPVLDALVLRSGPLPSRALTLLSRSPGASCPGLQGAAARAAAGGPAAERGPAPAAPLRPARGGAGPCPLPPTLEVAAPRVLFNSGVS